MIGSPPQLPPFSLGSVYWMPGKERLAPPFTRLSALRLRSSSAAAAVTSLNVEPGGRICCVARLVSGSSSLACRRFIASVTFEKSWLASTFGS